MRTMIQTAPDYRSRPDPNRRNRPLEETQSAPKAKRAPFISGKKLNLPGKTWMYIAGGLVLVLAFAGAAHSFFQNMPIRSVKATIIADADNGFMIEEDVVETLEGAFGSELTGYPLNGVAIAQLEDSLNRHLMVKNAEVYKTFAGDLVAQVEMRKPMVRLINNSGYNIYVDVEGRKFPPSNRHAARVMLVRGNFDENLLPADTFGCSSIPEAFPLFRYIQKDTFWNAQISEVEIAQTGEITLYPQVGSTVIEFGLPERIEEKFRNLRLFYEQGANVMGWNTYRKVSVKYRGQVVATRRNR